MPFQNVPISAFYDLIGQHRMPWIRQSDRSFPAGKDGEALIQVIAIKEIERESERLLDNGARRAWGYRSDADL